MGMFETEYNGGADPDGWVLKNVYNPNKATTLENGGSVFTIRSTVIVSSAPVENGETHQETAASSHSKTFRDFYDQGP